jgi:Spy/CpxP family protein refolding chaperone
MRNGSRFFWAVAGIIALALTPALALGQEEEQGQAHQRDHAPGARHGHDPEQRLERLQESLNLTEAQVAQVRAIFAEQAEKRRALKESEDHEGLRALHQETHDRLASALDDEQRAKLEELRQRHGDHRGRRDGQDGHRERDGEES